jgi:hypothetical protein
MILLVAFIRAKIVCGRGYVSILARQATRHNALKSSPIRKTAIAFCFVLGDSMRLTFGIHHVGHRPSC